MDEQSAGDDNVPTPCLTLGGAEPVGMPPSKKPAHPPTEPISAGTNEDESTVSDQPTPMLRLDKDQTVDLREATNTTAILIFVSVLRSVLGP